MGDLTVCAFPYQLFIVLFTLSWYRLNLPKSKTKESVSIWLPSYPPWTKILCLGRTVEACQLRGEGNVPVIVGVENSITAVMCHQTYSIILIIEVLETNSIPHRQKCAIFGLTFVNAHTNLLHSKQLKCSAWMMTNAFINAVFSRILSPHSLDWKEVLCWILCWYGEQGWRSGESACLPPMGPGFKSWTQHHK